MSLLKVAIIQSRIIWQDKQANYEWFASRIQSIIGHVDLIVLPEMFNTGFSMQAAELAEPMEHTAMQWMHRMASMKSCAVTGSLIISENGNYFNRLIWMLPDGTYEYYDKRHLFRMAGEHEHFRAGNSRLVINYKGWRICPLICYDLRFPVWSRNRFQNNLFDYDLLIYVANWPERRALAWQSLLPARAIENLTYVIGVNRIGVDGNQVSYSGDSAVLNYLGEKISRTERYGDRVEVIELDKSALAQYRLNFPTGLDADDFTLQV